MKGLSQNNNLKKWVLGALSLYFLLGLSAYFGFSYAIQIISKDFYGFRFSWSRFDIDLLGTGATLYDFKLIPQSLSGFKKNEPMIGAKKIKVDFNLLPFLFTRRISFDEIFLGNPQVKVIRYRDGTNSLKTFLPLIKTKKSEDRKVVNLDQKKIRTHVIMEEVVINNGAIDFIDQKIGARLEFRDVDLNLNDLNSIAGLKGKPSKVDGKAQLGNTGGSIKAWGTINFFEIGYHFDLKQKSKELPINYFRPYYQNDVPFHITRGTMNISSDMKSRQSHLTSSHHVTIHDLEIEPKKGIGVIVGLPAKALIDFVHSARGFIDLNVQVNGNLETGQFSVSRQLSRSLFMALVDQAKTAEGGKIKEKLEETGEDLKRSIQKINPFKK